MQSSRIPNSMNSFLLEQKSLRTVYIKCLHQICIPYVYSIQSFRRCSLYPLTMDSFTSLVSCLETFVTPGGDRFIVFYNNTREQFFEWWQTTSFFKRQALLYSEYNAPIDASEDSITRIIFGFWQRKRTSDLWSHFDQMGDIQSGTPCLRCKYCETTISHPDKFAVKLPSMVLSSGTNSLRTHVATSKCKKAKAKIETLAKQQPDDNQRFSQRALEDNSLPVNVS
jgi:hypothetical protein